IIGLVRDDGVERAGDAAQILGLGDFGYPVERRVVLEALGTPCAHDGFLEAHGLRNSASVVGPPTGSVVWRPVCDPGFGHSPALSFFKTAFTLSLLRSSKKSSLICTTGAFTQAPRHSTSITVKSPSAEVSPGPAPVPSLIAAKTSLEPQSQQGVVPHTWSR